MSALLRAHASGLELRGSFIVITLDADPAATALAPPGAPPVQRLSTARPGGLRSGSNTSSSNIQPPAAAAAAAATPAEAAPAAPLLPSVAESDGGGGGSGGGGALPRAGSDASLPRVASGAALARSAADGLAAPDLALLAGGPEELGDGTRHALLFLGVPSLSSLDEALARGIYLSDIPLHGMGRDIVLLAESRTQTSELAAEAERLAAELEAERRRSDALLASMMPAHLAASFRAAGYNSAALDRDKPLLSEDASVMLTAIEGFDRLLASRSPLEVHALLDRLYTRFDALLDAAYGDVFKVEHIDDAFLVVANATSPCARHADRLVALGFDFIDLAAAEGGLAMRVGISSGQLAGGVIGDKCLRYRVFGDTVNLASRMNGLCAPRAVHMSAATRQRMAPGGPYAFEQHEREVKGKGLLTTFTATRR